MYYIDLQYWMQLTPCKVNGDMASFNFVQLLMLGYKKQGHCCTTSYNDYQYITLDGSQGV